MNFRYISRLKTIFPILLLSVFTLQSIAQNLVPNPSFEDYSSCPLSQCKIFKATGWSSCSYTPDYFNSCNPNTNFSVPENIFGFQYAATGNAYAGGFAYDSAWPDGREYIGRQLLSPLSINETYDVSFKVCFTEHLGMNCGVDNVGILFSMVPYTLDTLCNQTTILTPGNFAHVYSTNIISDTTNWTTISGSFVADSAYQYIVIGNFFDDANTTFEKLDPGSPACASYYFIDDVSVTLDTIVNSINWQDVDQSLQIFPNPNAGHFTIDFGTLEETSLSIKLYHFTGQLIYSEEIGNVAGNYTQQIDLSNYARGIYYVQIVTEQGLLTRKVLYQ